LLELHFTFWAHLKLDISGNWGIYGK
jgi:hypothetical protein